MQLKHCLISECYFSRDNNNNAALLPLKIQHIYVVCISARNQAQCNCIIACDWWHVERMLSFVSTSLEIPDNDNGAYTNPDITMQTKIETCV